MDNFAPSAATDEPMRMSRSRSPSPARRGSPPPRPGGRPTASTPSRVLGIFGLSYNTREDDLRDVFGRFGELDRVSIVLDKRTGDSRGFGFVYFVKQEDAEKAVQETNGMEMQGKRVRVDYSMTERPHEPTPGRYMGESRRGDDRRVGGSSGGYRRRSRSRDRRPRSRSRDRRSHYSSGYQRRPSPSARYRPRSIERRRPSPGRHYSRSPPRRYSRSPPRPYSRSPPRRFSRSPPPRSPPRY